MAILGQNSTTEDRNNNHNYTLPVIATRKREEISLKQSIVLSTLLHPASICLVWIVITVLTLLGINLTLLEKPKLKTRDLEFVLVNKEDVPLNKRTKYRSDRNSRAGGKHDPKKKVSMPSPQASKQSSASSSASSALQKMIKQQQKQVVKQQNKQIVQQKQMVEQKTEITQKLPRVDQPKEIKAPIPKEATPPRPSAIPSAPKVAQAPKSVMQVPVPKMNAPKLGPAQGGPVSGTSQGTRVGTTTSGLGSGHSATPSFSPNKAPVGVVGGQGRFSSSGSGSAGAGGSRGGSGSMGNPGPGNPKGAPGIDSVKDPDFGPYMRELQRRIKMNWDPPKGNESKRVVLLFKISRDGRLLSVKVSKSSGVPAADRAAMAAVELTAPFRPLPVEYKGQSVDIQFTFDYNVFGANGYY